MVYHLGVVAVRSPILAEGHIAVGHGCHGSLALAAIGEVYNYLAADGFSRGRLCFGGSGAQENEEEADSAQSVECMLHVVE